MLDLKVEGKGARCPPAKGEPNLHITHANNATSRHRQMKKGDVDNGVHRLKNDISPDNNGIKHRVDL